MRSPLRAPAAMPLAILALTLAGLGLVAATSGYSHFVIALVALTVVAGTGLNVLLGLAGLISFGHAGFYALGAYASAILTLKGVSFWLALPAAAGLSALVGAALAVPAMRVRGPYLAMVTIAFGFLVEHALIEGGELTGGQNGLVVATGPSLFGLPLGERDLAWLAVIGAGLSLYGFHRLRHARLGQALRAVRDADVAAASLGFDPVRVKTAAFAISAALTGLAGAVLPPLMLFIAPSSFPFTQSILFVLAVVVGGAGTVLGPLFGALVTVLLPEALAGLAEYRLLFFGLTTLVVLWLVPAGIVGSLARLLPRGGGTRSEPGAEAPDFLHRTGGEPLAVEGLGIAFGGIRAADGVAFEARPSAITSVIGPNGAGKTTVLNMISGFYRPSAGSIRLGALELGGRSAHAIARAGIARTYQTTRLFGSLSVIENVILARTPGHVLRRAQARDRQDAAALLAFVGYAGALDRPASELPHVDRRLVEIARALAGSPKVLLLDEPAAGLARAETDRLGALLRRIAACGIAVILVEHDMPLVMGVSDRILVMDAGRPIARGTPPRCAATPPCCELISAPPKPPARPRSAPWSGPADAVLSAHGLRAGYGAAPVLDGIALAVRPGETVALLGSNGAGKSTVMRSLAGLLRPVEGSVVLADTPVAALPAHRIARLGLALVPEGRQVFPELTVVENIRLGAWSRGGRVDPAEVEALLDRFPRLRERAGSRAGLLSGGEQQMLAIARGMMAHPRILLLDEPSLGLAPAIINSLYATVAELRDQGTTILIVDQMAALALTVADRGYVLEQGRVAAEGTAAELKADEALEAAYLGGGVTVHALHNNGIETISVTTSAPPPAGHGRYAYSALPDRPVYDWPEGKRLAVYLALNLETFAFGDGLGAELAPGGPQPDVLNYAWRDWGNRVGAWRIRDMLDDLRMPASILVNSRIYRDCPGLIEAFRARGDEIVGHGRSNAERQGTLPEAEERALIAEATAVLTREEGRAPAGWLGPWISQSRVTPDLLAEAGYRYLLDWCHDDQPTWFATRNGGRILSVPYPQELNDIPAIVARKDTGRAFAEAITDAFEEMLEQSRRAPLVMGIALHPYIVGQPHRLRPLRQALERIAGHRDSVWLTTAGAIAAHTAELVK